MAAMNVSAPLHTPASVLLIDDDHELLELLSDYLSREGFAVTCAYEGTKGVSLALQGNHQIAVLDVMMGDMDGFRALRAIRAMSNMPVIMLSARGDENDRVAGLEHGADDYVPKPCTPRELVARLRAVLKRLAPAQVDTPPAASIDLGGLRLWPGERRAEDAGAALNLTSTEFSLLEALARHAGNPVAKTALSELALGRPLSRFDRSIDVHIHAIRSKLNPLPDGRSRIQTVFRKGYLLITETAPA